MNRYVLPFLGAGVVLALAVGFVLKRAEDVPVQIDPELALAIIPAIEAQAFTSRDGKVFCSDETLMVTEEKVFVWALCEEFVLADGNLETGSAFSMPFAVHFVKDESGFRVGRIEPPEDGGNYAASVRRLFPKELHDRILHQDVPVEALQADVKEKATAHFGL